MKTFLKVLPFALGLVFLATAITYAANSFPTSLNGWVPGQTIPSSWANALEAKIGADSSAVTS